MPGRTMLGLEAETALELEEVRLSRREFAE
jgi:hypothetical protein